MSAARARVGSQPAGRSHSLLAPRLCIHDGAGGQWCCRRPRPGIHHVGRSPPLAVPAGAAISILPWGYHRRARTERSGVSTTSDRVFLQDLCQLWSMFMGSPVMVWMAAASIDAQGCFHRHEFARIFCTLSHNSHPHPVMEPIFGAGIAIQRRFRPRSCRERSSSLLPRMNRRVDGDSRVQKASYRPLRKPGCRMLSRLALIVDDSKTATAVLKHQLNQFDVMVESARRWQPCTGDAQGPPARRHFPRPYHARAGRVRGTATAQEQSRPRGIPVIMYTFASRQTVHQRGKVPAPSG